MRDLRRRRTIFSSVSKPRAPVRPCRSRGRHRRSSVDGRRRARGGGGGAMVSRDMLRGDARRGGPGERPGRGVLLGRRARSDAAVPAGDTAGRVIGRGRRLRPVGGSLGDLRRPAIGATAARAGASGGPRRGRDAGRRSNRRGTDRLVGKPTARHAAGVGAAGSATVSARLVVGEHRAVARFGDGRGRRTIAASRRQVEGRRRGGIP